MSNKDQTKKASEPAPTTGLVFQTASRPKADMFHPSIIAEVKHPRQSGVLSPDEGTPKYE